MLSDLRTAGLVAEIRAEAGGDPTYQPARDPAQLSIGDVVACLEDAGEPISVPESQELAELATALEAFRGAIDESTANRPLTDL